jgi:transcription-repair coupling factor (superfamily II helicase)
MELRTEEFADVMQAETTSVNSEEFVADCVFESDLELLLPANYVPQESERIALYQELDNIEQDSDLQAFRARLEDRFGHVPEVTEELLRIPRLRRLARRLGIEKVMIKQDIMYLYFVDESNKAYYQSPMFGRLLHYACDNTARVKIRERQGRRSFSIDNVHTVSDAMAILDTIISLETV